jgi:hypothetical protein
LPDPRRPALAGSSKAQQSLCPEEITMNPSVVYDLGHDRLAGLHRQARRDALASAARRARRGRQSAGFAAARPAVLVRWVHHLSRVSAS